MPTDDQSAIAAAAWRARKRRQMERLLRRPGGARRALSAEMAPITFDGVPVEQLPRPPVGGQYTYPYTQTEVCPGSGKQVPVGAMQDLNYGRCPHCGRSVYVHTKGSLHKHSRPRET